MRSPFSSVNRFVTRSVMAELCTDINELTPTLVNTLIKKIEVFNSVKGTDGKKHVPIAVHFRAVGIITIPDEKELIEAMNEMSKSPVNVA